MEARGAEPSARGEHSASWGAGRGRERRREANQARSRGPRQGRGREPESDRIQGLSASRPVPPGVQKLAQNSFLKFKLPPIRVGPGEILPPPLQPAHPSEDAFAEIGRAVAQAKSKLDTIPETEFESFSRALDMYFGLKMLMRDRYGMAHATNASLKMYEILTQMGILACAEGPVPRARIFCNAELPGAFLMAIHQYARTMCPKINLAWLASSYYPPAATASGEETILGDRYGLYAGNRNRWLMGPRPNALPAEVPDVSGDLQNASVVAALADAVHERFNAPGEASGATLYTSDAGIDVSADYSRQEESTALLNFGQVLCGLLSLAPGGNSVTKQYTFVTPFSRSLIALIAALFDSAFVVKPVTSRPANSEVYIVGVGFRGIDREHLEALLDRLATYDPQGVTPCEMSPLLSPSVYSAVDEALLGVASQIHGRQQVAFLGEAAELYDRFKGRARELGKIFSRTADQLQNAWLSVNPVRRLPAFQQLQTMQPSEPQS